MSAQERHPWGTRAYVVHVAADAGSMRWHEYIVWARDERHASRIAASRFPDCVRRVMGSPNLGEGS